MKLSPANPRWEACTGTAGRRSPLLELGGSVHIARLPAKLSFGRVNFATTTSAVECTLTSAPNGEGVGIEDGDTVSVKDACAGHWQFKSSAPAAAQDMTPYVAADLLGIPMDRLDEALLRRSYRAAILRWHPDRNSRRLEEANFWTSRINDAKAKLDQHLRSVRSAPHSAPEGTADTHAEEEVASLYDALGVAMTASDAEIDSALAKLRAALLAGEAAHAVLSDSARRRTYDGGFTMLTSAAAKALLTTVPQLRPIVLLVGTLRASSALVRAFRNYSLAQLTLSEGADATRADATRADATRANASASALRPICAFIDCSRSGALCVRVRERSGGDHTIFLIPPSNARTATLDARTQSALSFESVREEGDDAKPHAAELAEFVSIFGGDTTGQYLAPLTSRSLDSVVLDYDALVVGVFVSTAGEASETFRLKRVARRIEADRTDGRGAVRIVFCDCGDEKDRGGAALCRAQRIFADDDALSQRAVAFRVWAHGTKSKRYLGAAPLERASASSWAQQLRSLVTIAYLSTGHPLPAALLPPVNATAETERREASVAISAFYTSYNPAKLASLPRLLEKHELRLPSLLAHIQEKYGFVIDRSDPDFDVAGAVFLTKAWHLEAHSRAAAIDGALLIVLVGDRSTPQRATRAELNTAQYATRLRESEVRVISAQTSVLTGAAAKTTCSGCATAVDTCGLADCALVLTGSLERDSGTKSCAPAATGSFNTTVRATVADLVVKTGTREDFVAALAEAVALAAQRGA